MLKIHKNIFLKTPQNDNNNNNNNTYIKIVLVKKNGICMIQYVIYDNNILCVDKKYEFFKYIYLILIYIRYLISLRGVWYTGMGSGNRHLIHFLPYSYVWINVKKA